MIPSRESEDTYTNLLDIEPPNEDYLLREEGEEGGEEEEDSSGDGRNRIDENGER